MSALAEAASRFYRLPLTEGGTDAERSALALRATTHVAYLLGLAADEPTARLIESAVPRSQALTAADLTHEWGGLATTLWPHEPARITAGISNQDVATLTVAADPILTMAACLEWAGARQMPPELSSVVMTTRAALMQGDNEDTRLAMVSPWIYEQLALGPRFIYSDTLPTVPGGTTFRDALVAGSVPRASLYCNGLLPTLEIYANRRELSAFQAAAFGGRHLRGRVIEDRGLCFGVEVSDDVDFVGVPVSSLADRNATLVAHVLGLFRVCVYDATEPSLQPVDTLCGYLPEASIAQAEFEPFFDTRLVPTLESQFWSLDQSRHREALAVSAPLTDALGAAKDVLASYRDELDLWRADAARPRPTVPDAVLRMLPRPDPSDYLHNGEIFVHIEMDERAETMEFYWVDAEGQFHHYGASVHPSLAPALAEHRDDRAAQRVLGTVEGRAGIKLVLDGLWAPITEWWNEAIGAATEVARVWYSPGRELSGAPMWFLLGQICRTEIVRAQSLTLAALVAEAKAAQPDALLHDEPAAYVDVFDASPAHDRLHWASAECRAVRDHYSHSRTLTTPEDLLTSKADVVHLSCHGIGAGDIVSNYIALSEDGVERKLYAIDVLQSTRMLEPRLIFFDVCSTGSVSHRTTVFHEGVSMAQAAVLHGAETAVSTEWSVGDLAGALYAVAFHHLYTQGLSASKSLRVTGEFLFGHDSPVASSIGSALDRAFPEWRANAAKSPWKPGGLEHLAAFEVHGRPLRKPRAEVAEAASDFRTSRLARIMSGRARGELYRDDDLI